MPDKGFNKLLTPVWVNQRFVDVLDDVQQLVDRLLASVFAGGYGPLESPLTAADLKDLNDEQVQQLLAEQPGLEPQLGLLEKLR